METIELTIAEEFKSFLGQKEFPCVAARAALDKDQIRILVVDHMSCPKDDQAILDFLYQFIDEYRKADTKFHSAAIIFKGPVQLDEATFDRMLWMRLQSLSDMDAIRNSYDTRVNIDPESSDFSFSLKEEAFFVIGMSPASSRDARHFKYPVLVFNPHQQFSELRLTNRYEKMQNIVRKRDIAYSGSINPLLQDFGSASEAHQYSGMPHNGEWKCPLNIHYNQHEYNTTA